MATYVVGDIHGCYKEWIVLKHKIESNDKEAKFILIGDIIDRGEQVCDMLRWAMKNISQNGKYQMVMGNHEKMKINWWKQCCEPYFNSGIEMLDTVEQVENSDILVDNYGYAYYFLLEKKGFKSIHKTIKWFETLPYYKDLIINNNRFIIAHGNVTSDKVDKNLNCIKSNLTEEEKEGILWDRSTDEFKAIKNAKLIYGHTPTILNEAYDYRVPATDRHYGKVYFGMNRINVDCGIAYKHKENANLAALRLDDLKEFYVFE